MCAAHSQRLPLRVTLDNPGLVQDPFVLTVLGTHPVFSPVRRRPAFQMVGDRSPSALPVIRVLKIRPLLDVELNFLQRVAEHLGPTRISIDLAGLQIPIPVADLAALEHQLKTSLTRPLHFLRPFALGEVAHAGQDQGLSAHFDRLGVDLHRQFRAVLAAVPPLEGAARFAGAFHPIAHLVPQIQRSQILRRHLEQLRAAEAVALLRRLVAIQESPGGVQHKQRVGDGREQLAEAILAVTQRRLLFNRQDDWLVIHVVKTSYGSPLPRVRQARRMTAYRNRPNKGGGSRTAQHGIRVYRAPDRAQACVNYRTRRSKDSSPSSAQLPRLGLGVERKPQDRADAFPG